jgi:hypothetical protein
MKRHGIFGACATAALSLLSIGAVAQEQSPKEQLVGTWTLVSWEWTKADATTLQFGANQKGIAFFDAGGRCIITVMRSDRAGAGRLIGPAQAIGAEIARFKRLAQ